MTNICNRSSGEERVGWVPLQIITSAYQACQSLLYFRDDFQTLEIFRLENNRMVNDVVEDHKFAIYIS